MKNFYRRAKELLKPVKPALKKSLTSIKDDPVFFKPGIELLDGTRNKFISLPRNEAGDSSVRNNIEIDNIRHLFSRAAFGISAKEAADLSSLSRDSLVDMLLVDSDLPAPPGNWVNESFDYELFNKLTLSEQKEFRKLNRERINGLRGWWLQLMSSKAINLREKMTLFWHGHFTSDILSARLAQYHYIQNNTLRQHAMGNFRVFLKAIYKDMAMLLYLDGIRNKAADPNENFARELLELFTMGVGNYSEDDIKEAARAFTGWRIDPGTMTSFFKANRHDSGLKTIFGQSGRYDGDAVIDLILQQDSTAIFICTKLYMFFICRKPDPDFITLLADTFRQNDYEIKPVLEKIFKSDHFYSEQVKASLIKSPVELAVSNARILAANNIDLYFILYVCSLLGQELLLPPNVAGWPGQRSWINPPAYALRSLFTEIYINPDLFNDWESGYPPVKFSPLDFAKSFNIDNPAELVKAIFSHLVRINIPQKTLDSLTSPLCGTSDPDNWSLTASGAERGVIALLTQIVRLPEFQLA